MNNRIAWGNKVDHSFLVRVQDIARNLGCDASWLMAVMAFESAETFSPSVKNGAGSGAIGLIQFMPNTAAALGTTTDALAAMTGIQQLDYVERYFAPWKGRIASVGDLYACVIWPAMIGKADGWIVFNKADAEHPKLYLQNQGLDFNKDGVITKAEIVARVQAKLDKGLGPPYVFTY